MLEELNAARGSEFLRTAFHLLLADILKDIPPVDCYDKIPDPILLLAAIHTKDNSP